MKVREVRLVRFIACHNLARALIPKDSTVAISPMGNIIGSMDSVSVAAPNGKAFKGNDYKVPVVSIVLTSN